MIFASDDGCGGMQFWGFLRMRREKSMGDAQSHLTGKVLIE